MSSLLRKPVTSRAAQFCTRCRRFIRETAIADQCIECHSEVNIILTFNSGKSRKSPTESLGKANERDKGEDQLQIQWKVS